MGRKGGRVAGCAKMALCARCNLRRLEASGPLLVHLCTWCNACRQASHSERDGQGPPPKAGARGTVDGHVQQLARAHCRENAFKVLECTGHACVWANPKNLWSAARPARPTPPGPVCRPDQQRGLPCCCPHAAYLDDGQVHVILGLGRRPIFRMGGRVNDACVCGRQANTATVSLGRAGPVLARCGWALPFMSR